MRPPLVIMSRRRPPSRSAVRGHASFSPGTRPTRAEDVYRQLLRPTQGGWLGKGRRPCPCTIRHWWGVGGRAPGCHDGRSPRQGGLVIGGVHPPRRSANIRSRKEGTCFSEMPSAPSSDAGRTSGSSAARPAPDRAPACTGCTVLPDESAKPQLRPPYRRSPPPSRLWRRRWHARAWC